MRRQFKDTCLDLARNDERVTMLFGDISVYLFREFQDQFPKQFYNLGILEQTIVSVSAGMAKVGLVPFIHTIAPFLVERAYEQIKLDLCYNGNGVNIVTCGAAYDYAADGPTHHCYSDLALMRLLPNMDVFQPGTKQEFDSLLRQRYDSGVPTYYRMSEQAHTIDLDVTYGVANLVHEAGGPAVPTVVTAGPILENVMKAVAGLDVNVLYCPTIKPIDIEALQRFAPGGLIVIHDSHGLGDAVSAATPGQRVIRHELPDEFLRCYGTIADIHQCTGFDPAGIRQFVTKAVGRLA